MSDYAFRFGGIARLYGTEGLERLRQAHVAIIGLGGVGSWSAEALARSGIGAITLVDLDELCVSNVNRQLPALNSTIGRPKIDVLAERIREINPECTLTCRMEFFTETTADSILAPKYTHLIDAIDSVKNKCLLIASCRAKEIPITVCGGAGGRRDGTQVRVMDLSRVIQDRLSSEVRKRLRKEHGFPRNQKKFGVDCVCSPEPPVFPRKDGTVCAKQEANPDDEALRLNCDWGFGSATFVTGVFGLVAAGHAVGKIAGISSHAP